MIVHVFVMAVVAVAFLASALIGSTQDPKSGFPEKALAIINGDRGGVGR